MTQKVATPEPPSAPFLSQALISGGLVFVSGQVHALPDNTLVGVSEEEKLNQIMKNITAILKEAGCSLADIVKVVIYVTDMSIMAELNKAYPKFFQDPFPVREAVCVAALPLGADIEISVIATKN